MLLHGGSSWCRGLCRSRPSTKQRSHRVHGDNWTTFPRTTMALFHFLHQLPHSLGSRCGVYVAGDKRMQMLCWSTGPLSSLQQLPHPLYNTNSMGLHKRQQIKALIPPPLAWLQRLLWAPSSPCVPSDVPCCAGKSAAGRGSAPRQQSATGTVLPFLSKSS